MTVNSLTPFFNPQGVAVVGASQNPTKLGYGLARNLIQCNYQGAVHFVNPKGGRLLGRPIYSSITDVPDPVDLAILLIPAPAVPQALRESGDRGIRAAIIASGGFRETDKQGADLESECLRIANHYAMRLLGPNCIGLLDTHLPLDATFLPPPGPTPGDVAFISHSGAICAAVIDWARGQGFGLSRLVSLGNQVDVNETDTLAPVAADRFTHVLTLYLEGVSDGRRFVEEARKVSVRKPIIALKVGRYASGQRAVASHTGALAGHETAFNAAFRSAGVIRADSSEEMFDWARALAWCSPPKGRAVAVLTNAGGPGVTAADALETHGLYLAGLADNTILALQDVLPPAASLHNPVDMLASASPDQYAACLQILLDDPGVHGVMVILPPPPMYTAGAVAKTLIPVIHAAEKPVVVALMGERLIQEAVEHFRAARVPEYRFPERAASALAILAQRAEYLAAINDKSSGQLQGSHEVELLPGIDRDAVEAVLEQVVEAGWDGFLSAEVVSCIMTAYGIPIPKMELAQSPEQAIQICQKTGFPVALKVASADIPHKSDVGGIALGLMDEQAVLQSYSMVTENARTARPEAAIQGVFVQQMIPIGQEVIVGSVQDPQFGALVMFGSGGVEVEGLQDVDFALAPLGELEASQMLENTWAGRKLQGYRNIPPADRQAVLEVLRRLAQLAADFPCLAEMEINPLRVLGVGQGVFAVDVRMRVGESGQ
jgi:acetyl coenzyme A synthetase (ADP forming)-like protein